MNKPNAEIMTTAVLRDLDPAPATVLTSAEIERADATFARILATGSEDAVPVATVQPRRRQRRLIVLSGLVAAGVAVPALLLGGGSAFASWTAKPESLSAGEAAVAAATCRAGLGVLDLGERVVNAERRGDWTYVLMSGQAAEAACLMPDDLVGNYNLENRRNGFFGTYDPNPVDPPAMARDRIDETEAMVGGVSIPGRLPFLTDEGWFNWVRGYVGSDVVGVIVHPPTGPDVEASVSNGRFAGWWPSARPSSENPEVMGPWSYTVILADGSERRSAG